MKKILVLLISFICSFFVTNVYGKVVVDNININVNLTSSGAAVINEEWIINKPSKLYIEKTFYETKKYPVSNITVKSEDDVLYTEVNKFDKNTNTYSIKKDKNTNIMTFYTSSNNKYYINYQIDNILNKYNDNIGIDYIFFKNNFNFIFKNIVLKITSEVELDPEAVFYIIGIENMSYDYADNVITLKVENLESKNYLHLLAGLGNVTFENTNKVKKDFKSVYTERINENEFFNMIRPYITKEVRTTIGVIGIILVLFYFYKLIRRKTKKINIYYNIKDSHPHQVLNLNKINYYDDIPLDGKLYLIDFIGGYYGLIKNRSDIIGAYILKWIFEDEIDLKIKNDDYKLYLKNGNSIEDELELELFNILKNASTENFLYGNKMLKYVKKSYKEIMEWYNKSFKKSIDELNESKLKIKTNSIHFKDEIYQDAELIAGLKKYLLNFNQVPRLTELTQEKYKYLLIIALELGIGKNLAQEIIRKNPNNYMATVLMGVVKMKDLYEDVYKESFEEYKMEIKNKDLINYYIDGR